MLVRHATAEDVADVARVQTASWEGVYRGKMPDEIFDVVTLEVRVEIWSRFFADRPARSALLVAEDDTGGVVGMASVGANRDDDLEDSVGELLAIYVDPAHWDEGYGRMLMQRVIDELRALEYSAATLWVLAGNERGRAFYERGGWSADGTAKIDESFGAPIEEVRYRRPL